MPKPLPPIETLRKVLRYEPETGRLFWKTRTPDMFTATHRNRLRTAEHACRQFNDRYAGAEAFTASQPRGARVGNLLGRGVFLAHRVAYALHHGVDPGAEIDHINGDPSDNRAENLRSVSRSDQARNMPLSNTNKSGRVGVFWITRLEKWGAAIQVNGRSHWLGYYDNFEQACSVRGEAEKSLGFHANHGRVADVLP